MDTYTTTPLTNWLKLINEYQYPSDITSLTNYKNNLTVKDGVYCFEFKVPGYEKDEIQISLTNGNTSKNKVLNIKAENKVYGKYTEQVVLSTNVEEKSVKASLRNGILKISLIPEKEKTKLIQIKVD
jgi:HSP20 family molecular chaperone IbpA